VNDVEPCSWQNGNRGEVLCAPRRPITPNGWKQFDVEADGKRVTMQLKPKVWKKLEDAQTNFVHGWVAAVAGKFGPLTDPD
jgi:hypothetical protein